MESRFGHLAIEALFPRFCVSCKREGFLMCQTCLDHWTPVSVPAFCAFCGVMGSTWTCGKCRKDVYLDGLTPFISYGNPLFRELLFSWKYDGDQSVQEIFLRSLRRALPSFSLPTSVSCVTYVPLHSSRERFRGFDQALQIAQWAGELFDLPIQTLVYRAQRTVPRARTKQEERRVGEMDDVFKLIDGVSIPEYILLCDDVFTSGSTMDAVARVLKKHGAKTVWGFVLAKGG
ncbi:TPA: hypothetical protein DCW61_01860 [Candidatus Uhrbacteria bacterium]|nr:hypothetical protein [Candidatus Uhrbacteria bacterium]